MWWLVLHLCCEATHLLRSAHTLPRSHSAPCVPPPLRSLLQNLQPRQQLGKGQGGQELGAVRVGRVGTQALHRCLHRWGRECSRQTRTSAGLAAAPGSQGPRPACAAQPCIFLVPFNQEKPLRLMQLMASDPQPLRRFDVTRRMSSHSTLCSISQKCTHRASGGDSGCSSCDSWMVPMRFLSGPLVPCRHDCGTCLCATPVRIGYWCTTRALHSIWRSCPTSAGFPCMLQHPSLLAKPPCSVANTPHENSQHSANHTSSVVLQKACC